MDASLPRRPAAKTLHLPQGMHYDCVQCGHGCRDPWEIRVDPEAEQRLASADLEALRQRGAPGEPPFQPSAMEPGARVLARCGDACVFLREDSKCALHAALGPKQKPQACIDFPFRHVETPAGVFVGLSFACTAVLEGSGRPLDAWRGALEENWRESVHAREATSARTRLSPLQEIDFDAYLEIERALDEILSLEALPLSTRLLAGSAFMEVVVGSFRALRGSGIEELPAEDRAAAEAAGDAVVAARMVARYRAERWGRLLAIAAKQAGSPANQRALLGLVTTFRDARWARSGRVRASMRLVTRYLGAALGRGRVTLPPMEGSTTFAELARHAPVEGPGSEWDALLGRYARHALFRKDLLSGESVQGQWRLLLMHVALVRWHAGALAARAGEARPSAGTLREALRAVEKHYVHHTAFGQFLRAQPRLAMLVDQVMETRNYAASMMGPVVKGGEEE